MLFIGDVHGKIQQYRAIIRNLPEGHSSLQLGDMGLGFKGVYLHAGGAMARGFHKFIRGNHDNPQKCLRHPCYLGHYGYLPEKSLFYLGGAWSIDAQWRTPGLSWWPDEELPPEALQKAYELYCQSRPMVVATHEAPVKAAFRILQMSLLEPYNPHEPCPTDQSVRLKGEDYAYFKAKTGCVQTRTSQTLQHMLEAHQPKLWLFGHYHNTQCFQLGSTEFQCLGELATREVDLDAYKKENTTDGPSDPSGPQ